MREVGRIEMKPVRELFPKEAHEFTVWLEGHIEALSERLGMELSVVQREKEVGDFNVDLLCEDGEGRPVIVENQLERTDHDHLGKLLTYLVNLNANSAIWVTPEPRPEHKRVIDWLNEATPADVSFYLVKVEALRIGESPLAPLFTILAGPDEQAKAVGRKKKEWVERHHQQLKFWAGLIEKGAKVSRLFQNRTAGRDQWFGIAVGKSGVMIQMAVTNESGRGELYIDFDKGGGNGNKRLYDAFLGRREEIESEFGEELEWLRLDDKRASIIRKTTRTGGLMDEDNWDALQDAMIGIAIRLEKVFRPRLMESGFDQSAK